MCDGTIQCRNANYISEVRQQEWPMARNILYYVLYYDRLIHTAWGEETVLASQPRRTREGPVRAGSQVQGNLKMLFLTHTFGQVYVCFTHNSSTQQSQERPKVGKCLKLSAVRQRVLRPIPKAAIVWE